MRRSVRLLSAHGGLACGCSACSSNWAVRYDLLALLCSSSQTSDIIGFALRQLCCIALVMLSVSFPSILALPLLLFACLLMLPLFNEYRVAAAAGVYLTLVTVAQYGAAVPLQFIVRVF